MKRGPSPTQSNPGPYGVKLFWLNLRRFWGDPVIFRPSLRQNLRHLRRKEFYNIVPSSLVCLHVRKDRVDRVVVFKVRI
jgi:hypothetical protein